MQVFPVAFAQSMYHLANLFPEVGVAVKVTCWFAGKYATQSVTQFNPAGEEVIVPGAPPIQAMRG